MTTLLSPELERADQAQREATPRSREPWFDNIKMVLVTLVVIGHAWALLPNTRTETWAYDFVYSWHIPAFALITGYLSRSFTWTRTTLVNLVLTVAVPYFVFEAAFAWYRYEVGGVRLHHLFIHPHYPMWYLVAVFFWRLSVPAFRRVSAPAAVGIAVALSVLSGYIAPAALDTARLLGFLPFFVVGLFLTSPQWRVLRSRAAVPWAAAGLAAVFVLAGFTDSWISSGWYYSTSRYADLGFTGLTPALIKLALLVIGVVASLSVFALVPRGRSWFTTLGSATLVVYLCHGFVVLLARYAGFPAWASAHATESFVLVTGCAVALALALAAPPIAARLRLAVDPIGSLWRFRRTEAGGPASPSVAQPSATPVLPGRGPRR